MSAGLCYLQEALGRRAAGLVVFFVVEALLLLALLPAQSSVVAEILHSRVEHLVDGQRGLTRQAGVAHPERHCRVALRRPEAGLCCCRWQGQRVWALGINWKRRREEWEMSKGLSWEFIY